MHNAFYSIDLLDNDRAFSVTNMSQSCLFVKLTASFFWKLLVQFIKFARLFCDKVSRFQMAWSRGAMQVWPGCFQLLSNVFPTNTSWWWIMLSGAILLLFATIIGYDRLRGWVLFDEQSRLPWWKFIGLGNKDWWEMPWISDSWCSNLTREQSDVGHTYQNSLRNLKPFKKQNSCESFQGQFA